MSDSPENELALLVQKAEAAIAEAEALAEEHGLEFDFSPAYGMGGNYISEKAAAKYKRYVQVGWNPSSKSC